MTIKQLVSSVLCIALISIGRCSPFPFTGAGDRIIGGFPIDISEAPYQVGIPGKYFFCSGSILTPFHILTAARCIQGGDISIRFGHSIKNEGQLVEVVDFRVHPEYFINYTSSSGDVAVLKLREPIVLSESAQPIKFASVTPEPDDVLMTSGWGATSFPEHKPKPLLAVNVRPVPFEECKQWFLQLDLKVSEGMICAFGGGNGPCRGDAGAPLVNDKKELVGLASWTMSCGKPGYPIAYTDVNFYKKFIEDAIRDL